MRVLFTSLGAFGHIHPMVPLARALRERGHEVRWATSPDCLALVEGAGIPAVAAGLTQQHRMAEFWRQHPETRARPQQEWPAIMFPKLFGAICTPVALAELMPLARSWRPDVVVNDAAELAAPIAAAALGVPHVTHSFGALIPESRIAAAADEVAPLWRAEGLEPRPYAGLYDHLYLDIYPPSLGHPGGDHVGDRQLLRPVPFDGATDDGRNAMPVVDGGTRPLVYLTFGTVFNDNDAFRAALAGIRDLEVTLVVTVGPEGDTAAFGPQPENVIVERYVPQTLLLPVCDVVVSHAGSGTGAGDPRVGDPPAVPAPGRRPVPQRRGRRRQRCGPVPRSRRVGAGRRRRRPSATPRRSRLRRPGPPGGRRHRIDAVPGRGRRRARDPDVTAAGEQRPAWFRLTGRSKEEPWP